MCSNIASEEQDMNDEESYGQWGNCPIELLIMIFTHLDSKTLAITMFVSKFWMEAVKYYCQHFNLWKQMVEENIANRGALYKEKCTLQWRELLMNFFLWRKVWKMTVFHHRNFNIKHVKTMKVYRDNLIVVFKNEVKYFNLVNWESIETLNVKCLTYEESDFLVASLSREQDINVYCSLYVQNKHRHVDCAVKQCEEFNLDVIGSYKLHSNCCYLMDMSNTLWVAKTERCNFNIKALAKFYGPRNCVIAMHVFEHRVYIVRKGGDVFYVDGLQFKRAFNILLPSHNYNAIPFLFNKGSAAYRVPPDERFEIYELPRQNAVVIAGPGLSALTEHGELVILGYDDGKIEIHSIYKVLACLNMPEKTFNIKEFVYEEDGDYQIHAIDVYEEVDKHYLIVAIDGDIHQFLIKLVRKSA